MLRRWWASLIAILCVIGLAIPVLIHASHRMKTTPIAEARTSASAQGMTHVTDAVSKKLDVPLDKNHREPMFAHRGFVENYSVVPNSFEAFEAAKEKGCPQVELDIRTSKDGVYYISHDATIKADTGLDRRVDELTSTELDGIRMRNGEYMHRLSELFDEFGNSLYYLIEFKEPDASALSFRNLLAQYPQVVSHVEVQSFYPGILSRLDGLMPRMYKQLLVGRHSVLVANLKDDYLDSMAIAKHMATPANVEKIHEHNKEVWTWTLKKKINIERDYMAGVDGVITDSPLVVPLAHHYADQIRTHRLQRAQQAK
ncbi:glycerophosphodiester phosphodiesterase [Bifidobacterium dolichotidis]|uniref:Glycerophosphodiester phosphodiesterase n=1 Tax=Bifidobacterium dolichotidis TaxID=2306976 RepID=A0A430FQT0_9BIFI|nr:glycerophosphodiester phosphodiesterase [Bifidobacterium dolichotidis]RSX55199.1 glycerophosphodiester phosphodiesterase [Bifidobacterium dolichotidis]